MGFFGKRLYIIYLVFGLFGLAIILLQLVPDQSSMVFENRLIPIGILLLVFGFTLSYLKYLEGKNDRI